MGLSNWVHLSDEQIYEVVTEAKSMLSKDERGVLDDVLPFIDKYVNTDITGEFNTTNLTSLVRDIRRTAKSIGVTERSLAAVTVARLNLMKWIYEPDGYSPIYAYRGMIFVNPFIGCNYGCIYCYRNDAQGRTDDWYLQGTPIKVMSTEETVERLINHPWFIPDITQIGLHTSTTDPFIPTVKQTTFELIESLQSKGLTNDIIIVSKFFLTQEDIEKLDSYTKSKILLFLTYTANPPEIEPLGNLPAIKKKRWITRDLLSRNLKHVKWGHYYRPIVEGWNDSDDQIKEALEFGEPSGVSVIGGLKYISNLADISREAGAPIPTGDYKERNFKYMSPKLLDKIMNIHANGNYKSVIVGDQSCGITVLLGRYGRLVPNVEGLRMYDELSLKTKVVGRPDNNIAKGCFEKCGGAQLLACQRIGHVRPTTGTVKDVLRRFGLDDVEFVVNKNAIYLDASEDRLTLPVRMGISSSLRYAVALRKDAYGN